MNLGWERSFKLEIEERGVFGLDTIDRHRPDHMLRCCDLLQRYGIYLAADL